MKLNNEDGDISFNFFINYIRYFCKKYKYIVFKRYKSKRWACINLVTGDYWGFSIEYCKNNTITIYTGSAYIYVINSKQLFIDSFKIMVTHKNEIRQMYELNKLIPVTLTFPILTSNSCLSSNSDYFLKQLERTLSNDSRVRNISKYDNNILWVISIKNKLETHTPLQFKLRYIYHLDFNESISFFDEQYKYISDIIDLIQGE